MSIITNPETNQQQPPLAELQRELHALIDKVRAAYPITTAVVEDGDVEGLRKHLVSLVREMKEEGNVTGLAIVAGWLLLNADKQMLYRFSAWTENETEDSDGNLNL